MRFKDDFRPPALSFKRASEMMEISEDQLRKIVKSGVIIETDQGLIEEHSVVAWIRERAEIDARANQDRREATQSYEMSGRFSRQRADEGALEHFKKELKAFSDEMYSVWNRTARKELEEVYRKIEARRLAELKAHGVPEAVSEPGDTKARKSA